jgi:ABC-2 type transport system ATP-binding protein
VQFDPGDPLAVSVDLTLSDAHGPLPDRLYLHALVLGPHDVPVWQMETKGGIDVGPAPEGEDDPERHLTVDFLVPAVPALLGAFALRVHVSDAFTATPLAVRRFPDLFGIAGPQSAGLLTVDYDVRRRG